MGRFDTIREKWDRLLAFADRHERKAFWVLFSAMLAVYLAPMVLSTFLPFSDLPGHLGVIGALLHRHNPEAAIYRYYWINPHFAPNCLEFGFTWGMAKLIGITGAARLFAAICVAALPLSFLYALNAFRRSPWLVFLAFPFAYPRIMWFGFMGATCGIGLTILSVALAYQSTQHKHWTYPALTALTLCFVGTAHPFFLVVSFGLTFVVLVIGLIEKPFRWTKLTNFAAYLPVLLLFYGWFSGVFSGMAAPGQPRKESFLQHLLKRRPKLEVYHKWLKDWSLAGYRDPTLEDLVLKWVLYALTAVFAVALAAWLWNLTEPLLSRKTGFKEMAKRGLEKLLNIRDRLSVYVLLPLLFMCLVGGYLLLPGSIRYPVDWWAVAQRLVTPLFLFAILLSPASAPRRWVAVLCIPAVVVAAWYGTFLAWDFKTRFNDVEMNGIRAAVARIPPGKRVLGLYDVREPHYNHFQLHFGSAYYVALRGGFTLPFPVPPGYKKVAWAYPKRVTPGPGWGNIAGFNYRRHGKYYDYFLIKRHSTKRTRWNRFPRRCVRIKGHFGLWTVVQRVKRPGC